MSKLLSCESFCYLLVQQIVTKGKFSRGQTLLQLFDDGDANKTEITSMIKKSRTEPSRSCQYLRSSHSDTKPQTKQNTMSNEKNKSLTVSRTLLSASVLAETTGINQVSVSAETKKSFGRH